MKTEYPGSFKFLRLKDLHVDPKYQRGEHLARAKAIARELDVPGFGVLIVSKRNGSHYVIDGQHRAVGASIAGKAFVPCMVFPGLPITSEARSFVRLNDKRKAVSQVDIWKANLVAEDEDTVAAQIVLADYGYAVNWLNNREGSPHINIRCGHLIKELHRKDILADTLHMLTACWAGHPLIGSANIIRAMAKFILILADEEEPDNPAKIAKRLKQVSPMTVDERARGFLQAGNSRSHVAAIVAVFVSIYNKGRRIGKLPVTI